MEFTTGEHVVWYHEMRGGYGYVERIPAEVVKPALKWVTIRVRLKTGEHVERRVLAKNIERASN